MMRTALGLAIASCVVTVAACASFSDAGTDAVLPPRDAGPTGDDAAAIDASRAPRYVYIFGGANYTLNAGTRPFTKKTYRAKIGDDGELGEWEAVPELELATDDAAFVSPASNTVVSIGGVGEIGGQRGNPVGDVRAASIGDAPSGWKQTPPIPAARSSHAGVVLDRDIYVLGGADTASAATNTVFHATYTEGVGMGTWSPAGATAQAVVGAASAILGERIYLAGGIMSFGQPSTFSADVWFSTRRADGSLEPFVNAGTLPLPSLVHAYGHALLAVGQRFVLVGGTTSSNTGATLAMIGDVAADGKILWSLTTSPRHAARLACAVVVDNTFYVLGGRNTDSMAETERGVLHVNGAVTWTPARPLPEPRDSFGCVVR